MAESNHRWTFRIDRLHNGLTVVTLEDHKVPLVSVQVWYLVGSKDENPERQGFAHMFEHMMFRGTDRIGPQDHFKYLSRFGSRVNGYTSFDQTVYWETVPSSQLDLALWLEAERMGRLKINEDYFAAEREVVKEERRKYCLNQPYGRVGETLHAAAYRVHPYRWTPIGNMPHLDAAGAEELRAFFNTFYVPNNATLIVVGDVQHDEVLAKARAYFGDIPRRPDPPRVSIVESPQTEPRFVEFADRVPSAMVVHAYRGLPETDPDSIALDLLSRGLSSGQSSRLYRSLVQGRQIAVSIGSNHSGLQQDGLFTLSVTLKPGIAPEEGDEALREQVQALLAGGMGTQEFEKVRNQELAYQVRSGETVQGRASRLGYATVVLGDPDRVAGDLERLRHYTAAQLMSVARRVLRDESCTTLFVRPDANLSSPSEAARDRTARRDEKVVDLPVPADMPLGRSPRPVNLPPPSIHTLPNGLRIAVFQDHTIPAVNVSLNLLSGAKCDSPELAGLAHVTFNTLRRGTTRHTGDELAEMIDSRGMSLGVNVAYEDASARIWTLAEHVEIASGLLAEVVQRPTFPESEVLNYAARAAAQQAIEERDAATLANRCFCRHVYANHHRGRPAEGTSRTLNGITREAVVDHHRRFIVPDRATLIFSGDVTSEHAFELAEKHFGRWAGRADEPSTVPPPPRDRTRIVLVDQPAASQSEIRIGQMVSLSRRDEQYAAARLMSYLFGESFSSRLNRVLRIEKGLTYGAHGYFEVSNDTAVFRMSTFTRTDKTAEAVRSAVETMSTLCSHGFADEELATGRDALIGQFQMGLETPAQIAGTWWNLFVWGVPESWLYDYQKRLLGVTAPAALQQVALEQLDAGRLTIVVAGRAAELREPLEQIAPVEVAASPA